MGLGANDTASTGHYQLLASDDGVRTFAVVPGATIQVTDPAAVGATGGEVTATAEVEINEAGTNVTHEYARSATVADATATVRVAYPGEYQVGNRTIIVTDDDVLAGNQTTIPSA
jgi:dolichyl-diphosphooligosaccharide--protein glycosyltransferase